MMKVLVSAALRFTIWSIISKMRSIAFSTLSAPYLSIQVLSALMRLVGMYLTLIEWKVWGGCSFRYI